MRTIKEIVTLAALAVSTPTLPMQVPVDEPFKIAPGAGIGFPLSRFDDGFKSGWHGSAAASYTLPESPVAFQVEGAFTRHGDDQTGAGLKQNLPYGTGYESRTRFGINVGAGLEFGVGRMNVFLESSSYDVFAGIGSQDLQFTMCHRRDPARPRLSTGDGYSRG